MNRRTPRRVVALSVAALTAAALGVLSGGTPAAADTTAPVITLQHPTTVAVPTAAATGVATTAQAYLVYTTDSSVLTGATITVDARKLAKIADVTFPDECTVSNAIATCSEFFSVGGPGQLVTGPQFTVTAHAGVAPGTVASYKITGTADSATFVGATGSVQIGGPAFNQVQPPEHTGLAVGSTVSEPVEFTNTGDRPAAAAQALLIASPGLTFAQHYANCQYSSIPDYREAEEGAVHLRPADPDR